MPSTTAVHKKKRPTPRPTGSTHAVAAPPLTVPFRLEVAVAEKRAVAVEGAEVDAVDVADDVAEPSAECVAEFSAVDVAVK